MPACLLCYWIDHEFVTFDWIPNIAHNKSTKQRFCVCMPDIFVSANYLLLTSIFKCIFFDSNAFESILHLWTKTCVSSETNNILPKNDLLPFNNYDTVVLAVENWTPK